MMKSSALFQCGLFHFASTRCHSFDWCSQAFPIFCRSSASVYYAEQTKEQKVGAWPGTNARLFLRTTSCSEYAFVHGDAVQITKGGI